MLTQASRPHTVKLPFLALSRRTAGGLVPEECPGADGHVVAFTTLVDAGAFLQQRQRDDLELNLIGRQGVAAFLQAVESAGYVGVGFDPKPNAVTLASLAELQACLCS
jgi:hypothetical protein